MESFKELLEKDKKLKKLNQELCAGINNKDLQAVTSSLDRGADIHYQDDYALRISSEYGNYEIVKLLVEKRADIHVNDNYPLRTSCYRGYLEIVKLFVYKGANVNDGSSKHSALYNSCEIGHLEIVKFLVTHGAEINTCVLKKSNRHGYEEITWYLLERGATF